MGVHAPFEFRHAVCAKSCLRQTAVHIRVLVYLSARVHAHACARLRRTRTRACVLELMRASLLVCVVCFVFMILVEN